MFTYMRALAMTDILYLTMQLQYTVLVSKHYLLATNYLNPATEALATYTWRFVFPLQTVFSVTSDFIVVAMTVNR